MSYYHLRIVYQDPKQKYPTTDYELDLSEEDAKLVAQQYEKGRLFFKGKWIESSDIKEIEIRETYLLSMGYHPNLTAATIFYGTRTDIKNVTRKFIKSPPTVEDSEKQEKIARSASKNIFIVHGREYEPVKELKTILIELELNPIILHEQPSASRTIVEKLEKHSDVGYAFVILTPDDLALSASLPIIPPLPPELPFKARARQNVVLEFGYFMGLLGRDRVCCLYKGDVELPSDMSGIIYIPFKDSVYEVKDKIINELKAAGYKINL
jgi:predicted nucleotide-binding protein